MSLRCNLVVVWCWIVGFTVISRTDSAPVRFTIAPSITTSINASLWPENTTLVENSTSTSITSSARIGNSSYTSITSSQGTLNASSTYSPTTRGTFNSSSEVPLTSTKFPQNGSSTYQTSDKPHTPTTRTRRISSSTLSTAAFTDGSTKSSFLWKGISIGLGSLCVIAILAFIITIAVLCRLRGQLIRMRTMLYPRDEEHVYDKLDTIKSSSKTKENGKMTKSGSSNKLPVKVELKPLQVKVDHETLDDEEIHSPMSPEPPPISSLIAPKTIQTHSQTTQNSQTAPNTQAASNNKAQETTNSVNPDTLNEYTNKAFVNNENGDSMNNVYTNDENNASGGNRDNNKAESMGLYGDNEDDDDLYEKYTFSITQTMQKDDAQIKRPKSFPSVSHKLEEVKRQNSLSGLPDSVLHRVNSQLGADGMPLQDIDEDFTSHFDSGIPIGKPSNGEQLVFSEGQSYENSQLENDKVENNSSKLSSHEGNLQSIQSGTADSVDKTNEVNEGQVLTPSDSVGFDLVNHAADIPNGQMNDDNNIYDNDDDDVSFNPFDDYMVPITGIPQGPDTKQVADDNRRADNTVSIDFFTPDVEYEDVDGVPFRQEAKTQNIFNTSSDNIPDGLPKLEPLDLLKAEQLRLRTDSNSTPDNYYLDLNEELSELKVEESKRISSQFPSDFYIRNMGSVEKLSDKDFVNLFDSNVAMNTNAVGETSSAFQNEGPVYQNLVFSDDTEVSGNESTT